MFDKNIFGERLREVRQLKNMSLQTLGEKLNSSKGTLSNIENGVKSPSIEFAVLIASVLNISLDYLVGRTNNKEINK